MNTVITKYTANDNKELLELAKKCPMISELTSYIDRSPDFFKMHQMIDSESVLYVSRIDGNVAGCLAATHHTVYINNIPYKMQIWGDFKVAPEYRRTKTAIELFQTIYQSAKENHADISMVSILKGNKASLTFTKGKGGVPAAEHVCDYKFFTILPLFNKKTDKKFTIRKATTNDIPQMIELYNNYYKMHNLAPRWDIDELNNMLNTYPGLSIDKFMLCFKNDELLASVALWDQSELQRYVVLEFNYKIKLLRSLYAIMSPFMKMPKAPQIGKVLKFMFLSYLAVKNNELEPFKALIRHTHNTLRGSEYAFLNLCLREGDKLEQSLKGLFYTDVSAHNFVFPIKEGKPIEDYNIKQLPAHVEYATLI